MFEDLINKKERILCGTCENCGKYYPKKLKPGKLYKCEICGKSFGSAGASTGKNPSFKVRDTLYKIAMARLSEIKI